MDQKPGRMAAAARKGDLRRGKRLSHGEQAEEEKGTHTLTSLSSCFPKGGRWVPLDKHSQRPKTRQPGAVAPSGQSPKELEELGGDRRKADLERKMENIQHHIQSKMLRKFFGFDCLFVFAVLVFGYGSLGVRGKVKIRDRNLGALQLIDGNWSHGSG